MPTVGEGAEKPELIHCSWECKICPLWKTVWFFLEKICPHLLYDPTILREVNVNSRFQSPLISLACYPWVFSHMHVLISIRVNNCVRASAYLHRALCASLFSQLLCSTISTFLPLDSSTRSLQLREFTDLYLPEPCSGNSLKTKNLPIIGLILFVSCLSRITVLQSIISNI